MSESSICGRSFETRIARVLRQKGIQAKRNKRSGAGEIYKEDVAIQGVPGFSFSLEAKSQQKVKLWEWWDQAVSAARLSQVPLLVIDDEAKGLAVLRFEDFCDLVKTIKDDSGELTELKSKGAIV